MHLGGPPPPARYDPNPNPNPDPNPITLTLALQPLAYSPNPTAPTPTPTLTQARRDDRPAKVVLPLPPGGKVLVFLPHCHATPDETLACLRFPAAAANAANADADDDANAVAANAANADADDNTNAAAANAANADDAAAAGESAGAAGAMRRAAASISVVQLPCCGYVWHDTLLGQGQGQG